MNAERRSQLRDVRRGLKTLQVNMDTLHQQLSFVADDEDDARSRMPESLAGTDRYEHSEECSEAMESALGAIDTARSLIIAAIGSVEEAI